MRNVAKIYLTINMLLTAFLAYGQDVEDMSVAGILGDEAGTETNCAQYVYSIGDYIEIDGVPALVFFVDESGKHGLAMSFPSFRKAKDINKPFEKGYITSKQADFFKNHLLGKASLDKKKVYGDLIDKLGDNGEDNTKIIEEYCQEKNLSLKKTFPMVYWVKQLGDGWFVPGEREINLFAQFYMGGIGKDYSLPGTKFIKLYKMRCSDERAGYIARYSVSQYTSSIKRKYGFLKLWPFTMLGFSAKTSLELSDRGVKEKTLTVHGVHVF